MELEGTAPPRASVTSAGLLTVVAGLLALPILGIALALGTGGGLPPSVVQDAVSDSVGATAAQFRVDESGAATYNIPIYTVPGRAGVAPSMSLSYSSQAGDGPLGKGWTIAGLSSITRCRATREAGDFIVGGVPTDGTPNPVNFSTTDRYCLDGQRLLASTDTCGTVGGFTGASMRTEVDSFARVCAYGPTPNDARFFTVQRKDGSVSWYGDRDSATSANRPDGYFESTSPGFTTYALSWAQTRMQDSAGNTIDYKWIENPAGAGNGELLIGEVQFTGKVPPYGGTGTTSAPFAKLVFNYSARAATQWTMAFVSGGVTRQTRRLESITSCGTLACDTANTARHYQLTYATSVSNSGVDTLIGLQECRDSTLTICLRPTSFGWSDAKNQLLTANVWDESSFGSLLKFEGFKLGDINGDGRPDLVWLKDGSTGETCPTEHIMVSYGQLGVVHRQSFSAPVMAGCTPTELMTGLDEGSWQLFDYTGDGRDDFFAAGAYGTKYYLYAAQNNPSQPFNTSVDLLANIVIPMVYQQGSWNNTMHPVMSDFNGDGQMDVIYKTQGTPKFRVRLMEKSGSTWVWGAERGVAITNTSQGDCPPEALSGTCALGVAEIFDPRATRLVDFDGDASSDLMFNQPLRWQEPCDPEDIPCKPYHVNAPQHFAARVSSITATTITVTNIGNPIMGAPAIDPLTQFGDINGDGLTDLVYRQASSNTFVYQLNTGRGFLSPVAIAAVPIPELTKLVDVNGDGRSDFVYVDLVAGANPWAYKQRQALRGGGFSAATAIPGDQVFACLGSGCDPKKWASMFTDLDADGALDYMTIEQGDSPPAFYVAQSTQAHRGKPRDAIVSVVNGLGSRTDLTYSSLANAQVYVRAANSRDTLVWGRGAPVQDFLAPMYVVSKASSSAPQDGVPNAMASVYYQYSGGRVQGGGRGFLGFQYLISIDPNHANGVVRTQTQYNQAFPHTGMPGVTMKSLAGPTAFTPHPCIDSPINDSCYGVPGAALPTFASSWFVYNQHYYENDVEWAGTPEQPLAWNVQAPVHVRTKQTNEYLRDPWTGVNTSLVSTYFTYGAYGNVVQTQADTFNADATLASTILTDNTYTDNPSKWWLGRLTATTVTHRRPSKPDVVRTTAFTYDGTNGMLTSERLQPGGGAALDMRKQYTLDGYGNRTVSMSCANPATGCDTSIVFHPANANTIERYARTTYDANGRYPLATYEPFWNGVGATEVVTQQVESRDLFGNVLRASDANGTITTSMPGALGRAYYTWTETGDSSVPNIGGANSFTTFRWCGTAGGEVTCPDGARYRQRVTTSTGPTNWSYYDALGRAVMSVNETFNAGVANKQLSAVCTGYEVSGKVSRVTNPFFLGGSPGALDTASLSAACLGAQPSTITTYDTLGRVVRTTAPDSTYIETTYESNWTKVRDPRGNLTQELRNGKGEVILVRDARNGEMSYFYNADGTLVNVFRASGRNGQVVHGYYYDALGRKVRQDDPDSGTTWFAYNAAGELTAQWDLAGNRTDYEIDARGRIWRKTVKSAAGVVESQATFVYDTAANGLGKLASESITGQYTGWGGQSGMGLSFARSVGYDLLGRPIAATTTIDGVDYSTAAVYDDKGRPFRTQDVSGRWTKTEWNARGYATAVCASDATDTSPTCTDTWQRTLEMDAWGHPILESRGASGALRVARTYDDVTGKLERLCGGLNGACGVMDEQYGWDAAGNLHSHLKESRYMETFTYDELNRLLESRDGTNAVVQSFVYDPLGNICRKLEYGQTQDYTYSGRAGCGVGALPGGGSESPIGPTRLVQVGAAYMGYDDHGNMVSKTRSDTPGTWQDRAVKYSFDDHAYEIALGSTSAPVQVTRFWYGSDGARYKREDGGKRTLYLGNVEVIIDAGVTTYRRYLGDVAIQDVVGGISSDRFTFKDQLGSIVRITDANGAVLQTRDFDAFGEKRNPANPMAAGGINSPNYTSRGFTGHETIDGAYMTYAVHMGGRLYDSSVGRFMQVDPVIQSPGNMQSWNAYTYVFNNPLTYTDPTGMWGVKEQNTLRQVGVIVLSVFTMGMASWMPAVWAAYGPAIAMATGFAAGMLASNGNFKSGMLSAFSALVSFGIGTTFTSDWSTAAASAVSGGLFEMLQGGDFGHGFLAAGLTAVVMPQVAKIDDDVARTAVGAIVGGTLSEVTGGNFANGAVSGAIQAAMAGSSARRGLSDSDSAYQERDDLEAAKIAPLATEAANESLGSSIGQAYPTLDSAARAWAKAVRPVATKYNTEIASRFFKVKGGYAFGSATSDGYINTVDPTFAGSVSGARYTRGYIHTHPSNNLFSENDLNWAYQMKQEAFGTHQRAFVVLKDGSIYSWSTMSWANRPKMDSWAGYMIDVRKVKP